MKNIKGTIALVLMLIIVSVILFFAIRLPFKTDLSKLDFEIEDSNNNFHYETNEVLNLIVKDSQDLKNRKITWFFGNGDTIQNKFNPRYTYKNDGKYLITLELDQKYKKNKYIDIINPVKKEALDSVPEILAPKEAYVGEEVVFTSFSKGAKEWFWEFGETSFVDAYDEQSIYVYKNPGVYVVTLKTDNTRFPIRHIIKIKPLFEPLEIEDPVDSVSIAENDIKTHLQAIADARYNNRKAYYKHVQYIIKKYTCNEAKNVVVVINDDKYNDIYSYTQGLHYLDGKGSKSLTIDKVAIDTIRCINRIEVSQSIKK